MAIIRKPAGPTVEEARAAMIAAKQVPSKLREHDVPPDRIELPHLSGDVVLPPIEEDKPDKPGLAEQIISGRPNEDEPEQVPPAKKKQPEVERIDSDKYAVEIRQENGEWVGEIVYKNGAGTERFKAPTKTALMLKFGEGKANATLRGREAVRREKLGGPRPTRLNLEVPDDKEAQKQLLKDKEEALQAMFFTQQHPEYYATPLNSERLQDFLRNKNLDVTVENLEIAYEELMDDDLLDVRPEKSVPQAAKVVEDSTPELEPEVKATPVSTEKVVPLPATPPAPAPRKRGTSGLKPEHSSASDVPEEDDKSAEPSVAETRTMPFKDLARIVHEEQRRQRSLRR
jgi:hypothetical protein